MRSLFVCAMALAIGSPVLGQSKQVFGPNPNLPFSAAVKADGLIYVSGTINAETKGDIKAQTKATLDSIAGVLKTAGSSLPNAASVTVYLRNVGDFAAMNEVYAKYFPTNPPARSTVQVVRLPKDALVEIEVIATR